MGLKFDTNKSNVFLGIWFLGGSICAFITAWIVSDLQVYPNPDALFVYTCVGIFCLSVGLISIAFNLVSAARNEEVNTPRSVTASIFAFLVISIVSDIVFLVLSIVMENIWA